MPSGRNSVHLCGVPESSCCGSLIKVNKSLGAGMKGHASPCAAFNCMKAYLLKQGYTQIGAKEFSPPDGGPVRVLTKKTRYGGKLRPGKEGTRNEPLCKRAGVIIG